MTVTKDGIKGNSFYGGFFFNGILVLCVANGQTIAGNHRNPSLTRPCKCYCVLVGLYSGCGVSQAAVGLALLEEFHVPFEGTVSNCLLILLNRLIGARTRCSPSRTTGGLEPLISSSESGGVVVWVSSALGAVTKINDLIFVVLAEQQRLHPG